MGDLVGEIENAGIMGDDDDSAAGPNCGGTQQLHDRMTGPSVKG